MNYVKFLFKSGLNQFIAFLFILPIKFIFELFALFEYYVFKKIFFELKELIQNLIL